MPLRFSLQDVYRFDERRILAGRVESGTLKVGDRLQFCPANKVSTVKSIERWSAPATEVATASESIGITLTEQIFVERGAVGAREESLPYNLNRFRARVFWMGRAPFSKGKLYKLKLLAQEVDCEIDTIEKVLDAFSRLNTQLGTTIVLVTHDPEIAERLPRTVTIRDGRIGGEGRSGEEYAVVTADGFVPLPAHALADLPPGTLLRLHPTQDGYLLAPADEEGDDA